MACENPYDNVSDAKYYQGDPFVSLSSEQAAIRLGVNENNNHTDQPGVFQDSLVLSQVLDHDIMVTLEVVDQETLGEVGIHFTFKEQVSIQAGKNYGSYWVRALDIPADELSKYKLSIRIKAVDDQGIIAGLYGIKKENEERQKRFKTYSFQK